MADILVTGVNGFVGIHLVRELHSRDHSVHGTGQAEKPDEDIKNLLTTYTPCELTERDSVDALPLKSVHAIINLAGLANAGASEGQSDYYERVNVAIHTVIADRILDEMLPITIIAVSSGAVYDPLQPLPLTETSALGADETLSPYARSKKHAELALAERIQRGLRCVIVRPFNHIGPGQGPGFLVPDLAASIVNSMVSTEPVVTGNLETKRDYTDVRDVVRAYALLAERPYESLHHHLFNICSEKSIAGKEMFRLLSDAFVAPDLVTQVDPARVRKHDILDIYGSAERLHAETNWRPGYDIATTISNFVDWYRKTTPPSVS